MTRFIWAIVLCSMLAVSATRPASAQDTPSTPAPEAGERDSVVEDDEDDPPVIIQPNFGWVRHPPTYETFSWKWWLSFIGGIEVGYYLGQSDVVSGIRDEADQRTTVASGAVPLQGWRVSVLSVPSKTGWILAPTAGFLSQSLFIRDFVADIPQETPPGATDIGASCADPDTGATQDCDGPNTYDLDFLSGYAGVFGGYGARLRIYGLELFAQLTAGVNAVEWRRFDATFDGRRLRDQRFVGFRSFNAAGSIGFVIPGWHIGVRAAVIGERYLRFDFARPLEFRGPVVFDEDRDKYVRPRTFVSDTRFTSLSGQINLAIVF